MDLLEIKKLLVDALDELYEKDAYLIDHDVHEQAISSKLACYLNMRILFKTNAGWNVDAEYNRNGEAPKSLIEIGNVVPDIIIHRRGLNNPNKTEYNNLLVIEIKKNPSEKDKAEDIKKIRAFINEPPFYYCFGAFVSINKEYDIEWFVRNNEQG